MPSRLWEQAAVRGIAPNKSTPSLAPCRRPGLHSAQKEDETQRTGMNLTWLEFVVGCLATYRLALLFSKEEGPAKAASKVRAAAPAGWIKRGFSCEWCQSFWWGMATSLFFTLKGQIAWIDFVI
jgi:hypothetical protein